MTHVEVVANFGGQERLQTLGRFLQALKELGVTMFILSHGRSSVIERMLTQVQLVGFFQKVFAADMPELIAFQGVKAKIIQEYIVGQNGLCPASPGSSELARASQVQAAAASCLFTDDTSSHIDIANQLGVCRTYTVRDKAIGLADTEMLDIYNWCVPRHEQRAREEHTPETRPPQSADKGKTNKKGARVHFSPLTKVCLIKQENNGRQTNQIGDERADRTGWVCTAAEAGGTLFKESNDGEVVPVEPAPCSIEFEGEDPVAVLLSGISVESQVPQLQLQAAQQAKNLLANVSTTGGDLVAFPMEPSTAFTYGMAFQAPAGQRGTVVGIDLIQRCLVVAFSNAGVGGSKLIAHPTKNLGAYTQLGKVYTTTSARQFRLRCIDANLSVVFGELA
jgi:hypothetical protein